MFTARTIGSLIAFFIYKIIQKGNYQHVEHRIMGSWGIIISFMAVLFVVWKTRVG